MNNEWYLCKKGVVTTQKADEVITEMEKVIKGGEGAVNIWLLREKDF